MPDKEYNLTESIEYLITKLLTANGYKDIGVRVEPIDGEDEKVLKYKGKLKIHAVKQLLYRGDNQFVAPNMETKTTMNYELALKLKEAGFPQKTTIKACANGICTDVGLPYEPTLSELIAACGDKFGALEKIALTGIEWQAFSRQEFQKYGQDSRLVGNATGYAGSTPEEAVANLYLALNQK